MTGTPFSDKVKELTGDDYTFLEPFVSQKITPKLLCKHNICGFEWTVSVKHFLYSGTRCPMCTKDSMRKLRQKTQQEFTSEVTSIVGNEYTFLEDYKGTDTKINCVHNICGHTYKVTPYKFIHAGRRCPACAIVKRTEKARKPQEQFTKEFNSMFSGYTLVSPYTNQYSKVTIKHNKCGRTFKRTAKSLYVHKTLCCDYCDIQSFGETTINNYLDSIGVGYLREFRFDDCRNKNTLPFDFALLAEDGSISGVIEYDGKQHYEVTGGYYGGRKQLAERKRIDNIKTNFCENKGIPLKRIRYGLTEREIQEEVLDFINTVNKERSVKKR